jgi:hypothetical protein
MKKFRFAINIFVKNKKILGQGEEAEDPSGECFAAKRALKSFKAPAQGGEAGDGGQRPNPSMD